MSLTVSHVCRTETRSCGVPCRLDTYTAWPLPPLTVPPTLHTQCNQVLPARLTVPSLRYSNLFSLRWAVPKPSIANVLCMHSSKLIPHWLLVHGFQLPDGDIFAKRRRGQCPYINREGTDNNILHSAFLYKNNVTPWSVPPQLQKSNCQRTHALYDQYFNTEWLCCISCKAKLL